MDSNTYSGIPMWIGYFAQREEELVRQVIASTIPSSENSALVHTREMERAIASTMPSDPLQCNAELEKVLDSAADSVIAFGCN